MTSDNLSQSDRIRRAYNAYTTVMSFGVNKSTFGEATGHAAEMGLNTKAFYGDTRLYVERKKDEEFLRSFLKSDAMSLWIIGSVGTGKTTIAYKVLLEHSDRFKVPLLIVDFGNSQTATSLDGCMEHADIEECLKKELVKDINAYVADLEVEMAELACAFFRSGGGRSLEAGPSQNHRQQIHDR
ncbi:MAG: hypothetical protein K8R46_07355 [Pirellulales bacterium]|nr:hypothetical protein [Pirellulales bacterium]